jgi:hypothetical protein
LNTSDAIGKLKQAVQALSHPVVSKDALAALENAEQDRARLLGVEEFKFSSNAEMLEAMGLMGVTP